jgi:hypothetical protein
MLREATEQSVSSGGIATMTKPLRLPACFEDPSAMETIRQICSKYQVDDQLLKDVLQVALQYSGYGRAHGLTSELAVPIEDFLRRNQVL